MRRWVMAAVVLATLGSARAAAQPVAHAAACSSFGAAAGYDVFSDGQLNMSGTTVTGRIAAAGDVTVSQISIGTAGTGGIDAYAGGNFTATQGSVPNDVRYGGAITLSAFAINGTATHPAAGEVIPFGQEFNDLAALSAFLATQPGATAVPSFGLLTLTAPAAGLNVININSADLAAATAIQISATQPDATLLINVKGPVGAPAPNLTVAPGYISLAGITSPRIVWNLTNVNQVTIGGNDKWKGTLLAPGTRLVHANYAQDFDGQLIVRSGDAPGVHPTHSAFAGCLPEPPAPDQPGPDIQAAPVCVDVRGAPASLVVRLRNLETTAVSDISWDDVDGAGAGTIPVVAGSSDYYFTVTGGSGHTIRVTAGKTVVETSPTSRACAGTIEVTKRTVGEAPGGTWPIAVLGAGSPITDPLHVEDLAADASFRLTLDGGFVTGVSVPIGGVAGGAEYEVTELDRRGGTATVSLYPVVVTDSPSDQPIDVVVTNTYPAPTPTPSPAPTEAPAPTPTLQLLAGPEQPTLPPGAPDPPPGPDLVPALPEQPAADIEVTQRVAPRRVTVGATVRAVTRIRNVGSLAAGGVVARELPQYPNRRASRVAHVISVTTSRGTCRAPRPVRCELGRLVPGQQVVIHSKARVLVGGLLQSVVFASSQTPESNSTNNQGIAALEAVRRPFLVRVHVSAPARWRVGVPLAYRIAVTAAGRTGARRVRLCTRVPASLTEARAPGTFRYRGARCRDYERIPNRAARSFVVRAVPAAPGSVRITGVATAPELVRAERDSTRVRLGAVACRAVARRPAC